MAILKQYVKTGRSVSVKTQWSMPYHMSSAVFIWGRPSHLTCWWLKYWFEDKVHGSFVQMGDLQIYSLPEQLSLCKLFIANHHQLHQLPGLNLEWMLMMSLHELLVSIHQDHDLLIREQSMSLIIHQMHSFCCMAHHLHYQSPRFWAMYYLIMIHTL